MISRDRERGLSLIEAIVIATISALLALLVIPMLPRAATRSVGVAERGVDALNAMRAEREFRALVRAASARETDGEPRPVLEGDATSAVLYATLSTSIACASAGVRRIRLAVQGAALFCAGDRGSRPILRWREGGEANFAYSSDGALWRATWADAGAPYVRFELRQQGRVSALWIERAMADAP